VSPEHFVGQRDRFGGPAPAALDAALHRYRERLGELQAEADAVAAREAAAARELDARFAALAAEPA
jgi:argininosuccinate lyase